MKGKTETLIQPTMGIKWNSRSLLDMEAHMLTEFRQPLQVQSHLEMPGILVQLGHIQRT